MQRYCAACDKSLSKCTECDALIVYIVVISATADATVLETTSVPAGDEVTDEVVVLRPTNRIVMAGDGISLPCSSHANNESRWDFYAHSTGRPTHVYNGVRLRDIGGRRMEVNYDSCRLEICHLNITSVSLQDAGYYVCFEASRPKRIAASLVVLGENILLSFFPYLIQLVGLTFKTPTL